MSFLSPFSAAAQRALHATFPSLVGGHGEEDGPSVSSSGGGGSGLLAGSGVRSRSSSSAAHVLHIDTSAAAAAASPHVRLSPPTSPEPDRHPSNMPPHSAPSNVTSALTLTLTHTHGADNLSPEHGYHPRRKRRMVAAPLPTPSPVATPSPMPPSDGTPQDTETENESGRDGRMSTLYEDGSSSIPPPSIHHRHTLYPATSSDPDAATQPHEADTDDEAKLEQALKNSNERMLQRALADPCETEKEEEEEGEHLLHSQPTLVEKHASVAYSIERQRVWRSAHTYISEAFSSLFRQPSKSSSTFNTISTASSFAPCSVSPPSPIIHTPPSFLSVCFSVIWASTLSLLLVCLLIIFTYWGLQGEKADAYANSTSTSSVIQTLLEGVSMAGDGNSHDGTIEGKQGWRIQYARHALASLALPPLDPTRLQYGVPVDPPLDATWDGMLASHVHTQTHTPASLSSPPLPSSSPPLYSLGPSFRIVSYASSSSFFRLRNWIGSLHSWQNAASIGILVYDIGMKQDQLMELACMKGVQARKIDWNRIQQTDQQSATTSTPPSAPAHSTSPSASSIPSSLSPHLYYYPYGAFRLLILFDALQSHSSVLMVEPGMELRVPVEELTRIFHSMQRQGYFFLNDDDSDEADDEHDAQQRHMAETFFQLGMSYNRRLPTVSSVLIGIVRASPAYEKVVLPASRCALKAECFAPVGSHWGRHSFHRTVMSILVHKYGLNVTKDEGRIIGRDVAEIPLQYNRVYRHHVESSQNTPSSISSPLFFARGTMLPQPYTSFIRYLPSCSMGLINHVDVRNDERTSGTNASHSSLPPPSSASTSTIIYWPYSVPDDTGHLSSPSTDLISQIALDRCIHSHASSEAASLKGCWPLVRAGNAVIDRRPPRIHTLILTHTGDQPSRSLLILAHTHATLHVLFGSSIRHLLLAAFFYFLLLRLRYGVNWWKSRVWLMVGGGAIMCYIFTLIIHAIPTPRFQP